MDQAFYLPCMHHLGGKVHRFCTLNAVTPIETKSAKRLCAALPLLAPAAALAPATAATGDLADATEALHAEFGVGPYNICPSGPLASLFI